MMRPLKTLKSSSWVMRRSRNLGRSLGQNWPAVRAATGLAGRDEGAPETPFRRRHPGAALARRPRAASLRRPHHVATGLVDRQCGLVTLDQLGDLEEIFRIAASGSRLRLADEQRRHQLVVADPVI